MTDWKRTDSCGDLRASDEGREVTVMGWVQSSRDHGGVIFIDIRDHNGIIQAVFDPSRGSPHSTADAFRSEWVVAIRGKVVKRDAEMVNDSMPTGEIEIVASQVQTLNTCPELPFPVEDDINADEPIRMKYRFLDLRRPVMRDAILLRHRVVSSARSYLESAGFVEIETPMLTKATPEGARDFVVPCRQADGGFYALPQSPQLLKQILMASGFDRYYQIARCFRDEDLRADRQPEFSQIDIEMAFVDENEVIGIVEGVIKECFAVAGIKVEPPFKRIDYARARSLYGTDRPDTRFELELCEVSDVFRGTEFKVFSSALSKGGILKALALTGDDAGLARKDIDELTEEAIAMGAGGLAWIRITDGKWQSPIAKFLSEDEKTALLEKTGLTDSKRALIFFGAGDSSTVNTVLAGVRVSVARRLGLIKEDEHKFVWVENFPLFESEGGALKAVHHPFTAPAEDSVDKIETAPAEALSRAYDIVLNGVEVGGGSIRIHERDMQEAVLRTIGIDGKKAEEQFGFFLKALEFGAPPHGGVALGLDRIVMMIAGCGTIREVTAFPKTQRGACPLTGAPSEIDSEQMAQLGLRKVER
ncbi:MAG: aspartate--tRNA ligase [Candidatus Mycalebacterium zealandia]|nr:MAG: aspartate--tRNA ligase [Candidatus Mycalebacterium zealandia]